MNTKTTNAGDNKSTQTTSTNESRRDDDQFSNDWWREFAETWK
ncbi:MAG TPA: hypothetical protein VGD58_02540 [Herpetosiphonaceae bacterium]